jgi:hypothetical protein
MCLLLATVKTSFNKAIFSNIFFALFFSSLFTICSNPFLLEDSENIPTLKMLNEKSQANHRSLIQLMEVGEGWW